MATLFNDDFNRANSATTPGGPLSGPAPVVQLGTAGISNNRLYGAVMAAHAGSGTSAIITWAFGPEFDLTWQRAGNAQVIFGWTSLSAHYLVEFTSDVINVAQKSSSLGDYGVIGTASVPAALIATASVFRMRVKSDILRVWLDGKLVFARKIDGLSALGAPVGFRFNSTSIFVDTATAVSADAADTLDGISTDTPSLQVAGTTSIQSQVYLGSDTKSEDGALPR